MDGTGTGPNNSKRIYTLVLFDESQINEYQR
jgi:hypothetical protein